MACKPILFNTEMVRAILEGRKTQTRRIIRIEDDWTITDIYPYMSKGRAPVNDYPFTVKRETETSKEGTVLHVKPPYKVGDVLYVRETWCKLPVSPGGHMRFNGVYYYKADDDIRPEGWRGNWNPSIHMPKEAARLYLRVKDVYPQRLHDMTEDDAMEEGFPDTPAGEPSPLESFSVLWDKTIKRDNLRLFGWHENPWVWVIEFERIRGNPAVLFADRDTAHYADADVINPAT